MNEAEYNSISERVIGAAIEVHRDTGPGLLESAYEECLAREFDLQGICYARQKPMPIQYKGEELECGYRLDFLVEEALVVELKSVEKILPIHEAQLLTYLRLSGHWAGLLINFNEVRLVDGVHRRVWGRPGGQKASSPCGTESHKVNEREEKK